MFADLFQHVVKKAHAGFDIRPAGAVQIDGQGDDMSVTLLQGRGESIEIDE